MNSAASQTDRWLAIPFSSDKTYSFACLYSDLYSHDEMSTAMEAPCNSLMLRRSIFEERCWISLGIPIGWLNKTNTGVWRCDVFVSARVQSNQRCGQVLRQRLGNDVRTSRAIATPRVLFGLRMHFGCIWIEVCLLYNFVHSNVNAYLST